MSDSVNHPSHYGGKDNPYEAIKVIEAWGLDFHLGNTVKYIARWDKKGDPIENLEKAAFYLNRKIALLRGAPPNAEELADSLGGVTWIGPDGPRLPVSILEAARKTYDWMCRYNIDNINGLHRTDYGKLERC